jgi:hypothetical protein
MERSGRLRLKLVQQEKANPQGRLADHRVGILAGEGKIDLGSEEVNFSLLPKSKHPSMRLATKLRVSDTVMEPKVSVYKMSALTRRASDFSFLAVGALGLLAPFVHLGANKVHPCDIKSIEQLGLSIPTSD